MKESERQGKRERAQTKGTSPRGPASYPDVGGGALSYDDRDGERLATCPMARMPEVHTATLKSQLTADARGALIQRPDLRVVQLADGAADNGRDLSETRPVGDACLDFYHAREHLSEALAAAQGEARSRYRERFDT